MLPTWGRGGSQYEVDLNSSTWRLLGHCTVLEGHPAEPQRPPAVAAQAYPYAFVNTRHARHLPRYLILDILNFAHRFTMIIPTDCSTDYFTDTAAFN